MQDLSSGNQQRVQLAVALVHDPSLLVLDEPFSGLDPVAVASLKEILVERVAAGVALLFSSHQLDVVEELTRDVVIIDHGRVVLSGDVDELRTDVGRPATPRRRSRRRRRRRGGRRARWSSTPDDGCAAGCRRRPTSASCSTRSPPAAS